MTASFEKLLYQGVLLVVEPWPGIPLLLSFHARGTPTIMVRMFINLEDIFSTNEAEARIFITLDGPLRLLRALLS